MSAIATGRGVQRRAFELRAAIGMALFWISSMAVGGTTFLVLAMLWPHLPWGGLAVVSAVLGLSYVLAVRPGAIQRRATAAAGTRGPDLALRAPWLLIAAAACGGR